MGDCRRGYNENTEDGQQQREPDAGERSEKRDEKFFIPNKLM